MRGGWERTTATFAIRIRKLAAVSDAGRKYNIFERYGGEMTLCPKEPEILMNPRGPDGYLYIFTNDILDPFAPLEFQLTSWAELRPRIITGSQLIGLMEPVQRKQYAKSTKRYRPLRLSKLQDLGKSALRAATSSFASAHPGLRFAKYVQSPRPGSAPALSFAL